MDATIQRTYSEFPDTMNTNFEDVEYSTVYHRCFVLVYRVQSTVHTWIAISLYFCSTVLLVLYVVESEFGYYDIIDFRIHDHICFLQRRKGVNSLNRVCCGAMFVAVNTLPGTQPQPFLLAA